MRIQFYPCPDLDQKLTEESETLGVPVSMLVNNILNNHYGLIPPNTLTDIEIEQRVFDELRAYVKDPDHEKEFDLNEASTTFRTIEMVYAGKPHTLRARLGKKFAQMVGEEGDFSSVEQVFNNGKPKRTVGNRAAIYKVKIL